MIGLTSGTVWLVPAGWLECVTNWETRGFELRLNRRLSVTFLWPDNDN